MALYAFYVHILCMLAICLGHGGETKILAVLRMAMAMAICGFAKCTVQTAHLIGLACVRWLGCNAVSQVGPYD